LFLFDFAYTGLTARSACGQIGAPDAHWLGFAFYLTLTQSWFYAVICRASLAYQYGPVAAVSWSISVEVFFSAPRALAVTLTAILAAVMIHLWLYGVVAYHSSFIGRTASPLYGPLVAVTIYLVARYDTPWSRLFSHAIPVRLGEVSYSIYLLHEIIPSAFKRLGLMTTDIAVAWVTWAGSLGLLALISLVSYAAIERPARTWLRALLAPRRAPVLGA
jgi:peptidoglycan/LPS O-acetylase OafA/YrhL